MYSIPSPTSTYRSSIAEKAADIGQFHDHVAYLTKHFPGETFFQSIVGPLLPVSDESNPPEGLWIAPLEGFQDLAARVEQMYDYIDSSTDSDPPEVKAERWLQSMGLAWPQCFDSLPHSLASDLQRKHEQSEIIS